MRVRIGFGEELAFAHQRHVRGVDYVSRRHHALVGDDPAWLAVFDRARASAFEYQSAAAAHGLRQPEQVFARIELRLIVEADRAGDLEGQRALAREARGQPEPPCDLRLFLDLCQLAVGAAVNVSGLALQVTLDAKLLAETHDLSEARLVRRPVRLRPLFPEAPFERLVDQAVLRSDLGSGAPGDLPADLQRFHYRDASAAALQEQGSAQTHDACADHGDIDLEITLQCRVLGLALGDRGNPKRFSLSGGRRHQKSPRGTYRVETGASWGEFRVGGAPWRSSAAKGFRRRRFKPSPQGARNHSSLRSLAFDAPTQGPLRVPR